jgi:hypothetical protein
MYNYFRTTVIINIITVIIIITIINTISHDITGYSVHGTGHSFPREADYSYLV